MSNENSTTNLPLKSREWEIILYDENEIHKENLKILLEEKRCVGVLHDKDIDDNGVLKKVHYHFLIRFENAMTIGSVLKIIPNHESHLINKVKSFKGACRYLLHLDNPEKYQYTESNLLGNINIAKRYIQADDYENEGVKKILSFIESFDTKIRDKDVLHWCCCEDLYSVYRRGAYIFSRVIEQHNIDIMTKEYIEV